MAKALRPRGCPTQTCLCGFLRRLLHSRAVPRNLKRHYGYGHLHFITFSCYHRLPLLALPRRRDLFLRTLEATRKQYNLMVVGYVVMPEHVHLLLG